MNVVGLSIKKTSKRVLQGALALGVLALAPQKAAADNVTDFYFQEAIERYFDYPQNARTFGMAGASVPTSSDSSSVMGNPAGIGLMQDGEVSGTYGFNRISGDEFPTGREIEQRGELGAGMIALPLGPIANQLPEFGNIGFAWSGYDTEWDDDSFDSHSKRTQATVAYAMGLSDDLSLGYSLGWTRDKLQSRDIFDYPMGDGFRHTLGVLYNLDEVWSLGSSVFVGSGTHNALFGPGTKVSADTFQTGFDVGLGYQVTEMTKLAFAVDYRHLSSDGDLDQSIPQNFVGGHENGNIYGARVGIEHQAEDWLFLRAGYRYAGLDSYKYSRVELNELNGSAFYNAYSLGLGFVIPLESEYVKSINLDYGVEYRAVGDDDWEHLVTVSVPFTFCDEA